MLWGVIMGVVALAVLLGTVPTRSALTFWRLAWHRKPKITAMPS
jgi:hypothetical protein